MSSRTRRILEAAFSIHQDQLDEDDPEHREVIPDVFTNEEGPEVSESLQNINDSTIAEQNNKSCHTSPQNAIYQNKDSSPLSFCSEDKDDNIKDPHYDSDSSSPTSSSSSRSSSSSSSSRSSSSSESSHLSEPLNNSPLRAQSSLEENLEKNPEENVSITVVEAESSIPGVNEGEVRKAKKRTRKETEWMKPKAKRLRNLGKQYVSCSKSKKVIASKSIQASCTDKCRYKCAQKIAQDHRIVIFNEFYSLDDINKKREFINRNMESIQPKYRYPNPNNRRLNNAFYFQVTEKKIRVCKLFFKGTLNINDRTIDTVLKKRTSTGSVSEDKRGKHGKHSKVDSSIKNEIREHIKSIRKIESHYLRAQTSRDFIEGGKTIADLHRDYVAQCKIANKPFGNYHLYSDIFNTEFNLSFFIPKKDQCNLCFLYNNASEAEKINLELEYKKHQEEKVLSRIEKENDKKKCSENVVVACFDMQAVFQLPKGDTSIFYYKSKLNTMNLTITGLIEDNTWCFIWHEGEGGKGVTEVASCILMYLEHKAAIVDSEDLEIILYSDNCAAQQKNRFLIATFIYAVQKFKIKELTHKFLIVGHTQNEGDSTHSVIEKQVTRSLKSGPIYVPDQFIQIIRNAKKKGEPYQVKELTHEDFWNIKQLMTDLGPNFNIDTDGNQIPINDLRVVKVKKEEPFKFFYKTSFSQADFKAVDILKRPRVNTKRKQPIPNQPTPNQLHLPILKSAYSSKRQLNENKKEDLQFLLKKGYIPKYYHLFYDSVC